MILRYFCLVACLLGSASLTAQVAPPTGAWRQTNVAWNKPPAELGLKQRYAEARIFYFSRDHKFVLLAATVIQGPTSEAISEGDGRIVYLGTWKLTGNSLRVEYRLVSRTVAERGKMLPGPVQSEDIRVRGSTLLFQKGRFRRDEKLDRDLKAILEGESARQGTSDGHHSRRVEVRVRWATATMISAACTTDVVLQPVSFYRQRTRQIYAVISATPAQTRAAAIQRRRSTFS